MADAVRKLLDHIVDRYVVHDVLVDIDLEASASDGGKAIESDKQDVVRRERQRAADLADAFAQGLTAARQRHLARAGELALDDRDPSQNDMADALIRFLVSHDLAASRTEVTEPYHYIYYISVDWDRLHEVARDAGIDLDQAIGSAS